MQNVHRGAHHERRISRSGVTEEGQTDVPGATGDDLQSIDLNHATIAQLAAIDELGAELAHAIVERRVHHGHFTSWEQVAAIPGLQEEQLAALRLGTRLPQDHQRDDRPSQGVDPRGGLP